MAVFYSIALHYVRPPPPAKVEWLPWVCSFPHTNIPYSNTNKIISGIYVFI